jgi:hypothetical protein
MTSDDQRLRELISADLRINVVAVSWTLFRMVVSSCGIDPWRLMVMWGCMGLYGVILILFYPIYWVHPKKTYLYRLCCRSLMSRSTPSLCISHFFDSRVGLRVNCLKGPSKPALVWGYPPWRRKTSMSLHGTMYPLVNIQKAMENGPVEIVDLPSNSMVDHSSSLCKRWPFRAHQSQRSAAQVSSAINSCQVASEWPSALVLFQQLAEHRRFVRAAEHWGSLSTKKTTRSEDYRGYR